MNHISFRLPNHQYRALLAQTLIKDKDGSPGLGRQVAVAVDVELFAIGCDETSALRTCEADFRRAEADRAFCEAGNHHVRAGRPRCGSRIGERERRAAARRPRCFGT